MHFSWSCTLIWGWVCPGFGGCRLRMPDMGAEETQHSCPTVKINTPRVSEGCPLKLSPTLAEVSSHSKKALSQTLVHVGYQTNIRVCISLFDLKSWPTGLGHTSTGCVPWYMYQVGCVLAFVVNRWGHLIWVTGRPGICAKWLSLTLLGPWGATPPGFHLLQHGLIYRLVLKAPKAFLKPLDYSPVFGSPVKKTLCHTSIFVGYWTNNQGLYSVTARFIFVCQLDGSLNP